MKRILFTGGGSAGHVVPNLAVMRELRYTFALSYLGTGGIEQRLVGECGYPFFRVDCPKLTRSFTLENLKIPARLHRAKKEALAVLEREKPDLVFSKGGYASYPAVWAAHKLGIPALTHESDLSAGLCTRLIAKKCKYVLTSFPETAKNFPNGRYIGSPVRREVKSGERSRARKKFGFSEKDNVLLVFGGGSGSRAISRAVEEALPDLMRRYSILHITGSGDISRRLVGGRVCITKPYEADMGSAYAAADVVLSRAGSNTVFEILALKKRALLVPLVRGSRGDQLENARYFQEKGLVKVLDEARLTELSRALEETERDPLLGENLLRAEFPDGTENAISVIKEIVQPLGGASK